jgi:hypothetical protein
LLCYIEKQIGVDHLVTRIPEAANCEEDPELAVNVNDALNFQVACRLFRVFLCAHLNAYPNVDNCGQPNSSVQEFRMDFS